MPHIIRVYRIAAILLWSVIVGLLTLPYQLINGWKSIGRIAYFTHLWSGGIAKIINLRVKVYGRIPGAPGGLIVSNHLSYLDVIAYGSIFPLRYAPKSEISEWPVLGWYIGLSRPIWTNRKSRQASKKVLRDFAKTMSRGMYLIVYPEGTSTDGKGGILPFKSTPFEAAITKNSRILPALIRYNERIGEPTVCWYGDMTLLPHIWRVLKLRSIESELRFLQPVFPDGMGRKELAGYVHKVMSREY